MAKDQHYFFSTIRIIIICLLNILAFKEILADDLKFTLQHAANGVTSLNGTWEITPEGFPATLIQVPGFYVSQPVIGRFTIDGEGPDNLWRIFEGARASMYRREFDIGSAMSNERLFLRFEAVNFGCRVTVNDMLLQTHYGGFLPFEVDITDHVTIPSQGNTLAVEIIGNDYNLFHQGFEKYPLWPTGFFGHHVNNGIVGDVSLISRPSLYIPDIFIETSVAEMKLTATVTLRNLSQTTQSAQCRLGISDPAISIGTQSLTLQPDSEKVLYFTLNWPDAALWSPENPRLYEIEAVLLRNGNETNKRSCTFGFREFKQHKTGYYLNGRRITLLGDNIVLHGEKRYWKYLVPDPDNWTAIIDSLLDLNCNVIRLHQEPVPPWMIDICDEKGMLVIAESAIYGQTAERMEKYISNARKWLKEWVIRDRNHPSIILWSASNEMNFPSAQFLPDQIYRFGTAVTEVDSSRPVFFEGDFDIHGLADVISYHYIYGFPNGGIPAKGIYDINTYRRDDIPSSHGEFEWSRGEIPESQRVRYQCLKTRAMRIGRWADIRPYRLDWAWHPNPDFALMDYGGWHPAEEEIEFLKNSLNPVAAFDSAYYEFSAFPPVPQFMEGEQITRHIYIFNNEAADTPIIFRWEVLIEDRTLQSQERTISIPPGGMFETDISCRAPIVSEDKLFTLRLKTLKDGRLRFSEDYLFKSNENGISEPAPPREPEGMQITHAEDTASLQWNAVTLDIAGQPASIDHYRVFLSSDISFNPARTDSFTVRETAYADSNLVNSSSRFFSVIAVDTDGRRSEQSSTAGCLTYQLNVAPGTDFNPIAFPFADGAETAAELLTQISHCTSIASWAADYQGYLQYIPQIPASNFALATGGPVLANVTGNSSWTASGTVSQLDYYLTFQDGSTNVHYITLPFSKYDLTKASHLLADIPNCESVAYWQTDSQGYMQHIPGYAATDFSVAPGHPYFITISASVAWPGNGQSKPVPSTPLQPNSTVSFGAPHLAVMHVSLFYTEQEQITVEALLSGDQSSAVRRTLYRETPADSVLFIQCTEFTKKWHPGDTLSLTVFGDNNEIIGSTEKTLTAAAYDIITPPAPPESSANLPKHGFTLNQNYPNPFNAGTSITYRVPGRCRVTITVFDLTGRRVSVPADAVHDPGHYTAFWDGRDTSGRDLPSGIYICRVSAGGARRTIRMVHLK